MIRIGPMGWTHPGLAAVWPAERGPDFDPLRFLAARFGCVEVDITAHATPPRGHAARWLASLAEAERTRLTVRLPDDAFDLSHPTSAAIARLDAAMAVLRPLIGRPRLAALVASIDRRTLFGPAEVRGLAERARALRGAPLVLHAMHASWFDTRARDAVRGAGWILAHVEPPDEWDAPPKHVDGAPSELAMLRVTRPGVLTQPGADALAARVRRIAEAARDVLVVMAQGEGPDAPIERVQSALALKRALAPGAPLPAWPELERALRSRRPRPAERPAEDR